MQSLLAEKVRMPAVTRFPIGIPSNTSRPISDCRAMGEREREIERLCVCSSLFASPLVPVTNLQLGPGSDSDTNSADVVFNDDVKYRFKVTE